MISRSVRSFLACLIVIGLVVLGGQAATYYVSPTGSSGNPGTIALPWSISKANSSLTAGDTAILLDGSYSSRIVPANSGTAGSPITYRAANEHQATFDLPGQEVVVLSARSYIVIDGISATGVHRWVKAQGGYHHLTITNCHFEDAVGWEACRFREGGDAITFTNNYCHTDVPSNGTDNLSIHKGDGHYIANNHFGNAGHTGLALLGVQRSVILNNTLTNYTWRLMEVESSRYDPYGFERPSKHNVIEGNHFGYSVVRKIQFAGVANIVRRNIFTDSGNALDWVTYGPTDEPEAWHSSHNRFYNNVVYGPNLALSHYDGIADWGDHVHVNNIFHLGTIRYEIAAHPTDGSFFYNNFPRTTPGGPAFSDHSVLYTIPVMEATYPTQYAENFEADAQFVDGPNGDYHLQPGSPCIDAGGPLTVTTSAGSGAVVPVADSYYFTDGLGLIAPDVIHVGDQRVTIVSVDYNNHLLTVDQPISWAQGDPVYTDYVGAGPDLGAFEAPLPIAGRHIFYNNSSWDGDDPAASAADDAAIATDKSALLPGGVASFANYTSYGRGINGIMIDIHNLSGVPTSGDFEFKVGNDNDPASWAAAPAPTLITVRQGAGASDSDRVTILWPDNAIEQQWLQVTYLPVMDVFYFGNAMGETGNSGVDAEVTPTDAVVVRNSPATLGVNPAGITHVCDFNRDWKVGPTDEIICRNNGTNSMTALQLIAVPTVVINQTPMVDAGSDGACTLPDGVTLDATVSDDGLPDPPGALTIAWSKLIGPGTVTFGNPAAIDTTATFSAAGTYVLQLLASDGEKSDTDTATVAVDEIVSGVFFQDDFDDNNISDWTVLEGSFDTATIPGEPGYEARALTRDSRMRIDLADTNLSDTVYISFDIRHTGALGGGHGWKAGWMWFVDDAGNGFGVYYALEQSGNGSLELQTTTDDGNTQATVGSYSYPGSASGYASKRVELIYDRLNDTVECKYEGVSKGTISLNSSYRDFTRVVLHLFNHYDGWYGQIYVDNLRIANVAAGS